MFIHVAKSRHQQGDQRSLDRGCVCALLRAAVVATNDVAKVASLGTLSCTHIPVHAVVVRKVLQYGIHHIEAAVNVKHS